MTIKNVKKQSKVFGIFVMFVVAVSMSYTISEVAATTPDYHGHTWFLGETDYRYASFSGLNISQSQVYAALDAARSEINSASNYHADRVTHTSSNWISPASWSDQRSLGFQYDTHAWNYLTGSDIEINSNVVWSVGTDQLNDNIRALAIHELAHGVDLTHTSNSANSVMRSAYSYAHWENLHTDDEQLLRSLYG